MAEINVDRMLLNEFVEKEWDKVTEKLIKQRGYIIMLDKFCRASENANKKYKYPKARNITTPITEIADNFNIKPLGAKLRICPFHNDKSPSLSLSADKQVFNCFGCGKKGTAYTFLKELRGLTKDGRNNESNPQLPKQRRSGRTNTRITTNIL